MKHKKLTLIELIITILVLGLLAALAIPQFTGVKANADVASFKNDIDTLSKAMDESYIKDDSLPLGEKVTITDSALLDTIYATGDSATNLYKVDLSKSSKYHSKLKTKIDEDSYFIYSMETGKVFYTKPVIDGDGQTLYTMEYIGLANVILGSTPLISGMSVPVTEPVQTITGEVPATATVEVKVNGTNLPVTMEDVVFEGEINLLAGINMKSFTSEVLLLEGQNTVTIKVNSQVTNFKINLGESTTPVTPEEPTPIIKPIAVISMTPEQGLTTTTNIVWGTDSSTAVDGRTIVATEWEGKQDVYSTEGSYTVKLRVQDSTGVWSDWTEKQISVFLADEILEVATGDVHTMILKSDGTVWTTGYNFAGQLGTGDAYNRNTYVQVATGVKYIAAGGYHSMIIKNDNSLWITGLNNVGQLGLNDLSNRVTFVKAAENVKFINAGSYHSFIIKTDDSLWATGGNSGGSLGTGDITDRKTFVQVQAGVKSVASGGYHTLIIKNDNSAWVTGGNNYGQLGVGNLDNLSIFTQVATEVKQISANYYHSMILKIDGTVFAAGYNNYGMLGTGDSTDRKTFTQVATNVKKISAGNIFSLIIKEDNTLWGVGNNEKGQLGSGNFNNSNTFIKTAENVKNFKTGTHSVIIREDGHVYVTGRNDFGQLGLGHNTNVNVFSLINLN